MKLNNKKVMAVTGALSLLIGTPLAFAASMTVVNTTSGTVTNNVTVSSTSGGNTSMGARGARGGDGGSTSVSGPSGSSTSSTAGNGGAGGAGGAGGNIFTGDSIGTADIHNDVNTTDTNIEDLSSSSDRYNETMTSSSRVGSSAASWLNAASHTHDSSSYSTGSESTYSNTNTGNEWSEGAASTTGTASTSSNYNTGSAWDTSENSSDSTWDNTNMHTGTMDMLETASSSENHNDQDVTTTHTYVDSNDSYTVVNGTEGGLMTNTSVETLSGGNTSTGERGSRGGNGGSTAVSGLGGSSTTGGAGAVGGAGGVGGMISTGVSDSLSSIVSTIGRTVTRIVRH